ncbi:hypothetical protein U1Q18_051109 [Sarracenia purpurea var. burkii]
MPAAEKRVSLVNQELRIPIRGVRRNVHPLVHAVGSCTPTLDLIVEEYGCSVVEKCDQYSNMLPRDLAYGYLRSECHLQEICNDEDGQRNPMINRNMRMLDSGVGEDFEVETTNGK